MNSVYVSGTFDDLRTPQVRFLEEASRLGAVHVLLWTDALAKTLAGQSPKFTQAERKYFLDAVRYVAQVTLVDKLAHADCLPLGALSLPAIWAVMEKMSNPAKASFCQANGIGYQVISAASLRQFPGQSSILEQPASGRKKVLVTGCYDWLHTGHVRFFEEAAQLGDLYVVVGSDANVRLLKGEGHPLFREAERQYMVQSMRYVTEVRVSTGTGWMDAEPELEQIRPDIYLVNEDGDKPEKRAFCQARGLEYVVLKRLPKAGLPRRESTQLRGF